MLVLIAEVYGKNIASLKKACWEEVSLIVNRTVRHYVWMIRCDFALNEWLLK